MAKIEHFQNSEEKNTFDNRTQPLVEKIRRENIEERSRAENYQFAAPVCSKTSKMLITNGWKIPLYSPEVIEKMKNYRGPRKRKTEFASQPSLWPTESVEISGFRNIFDPEKKLFDLGRDLDSLFRHNRVLPITEEIREKKLRLRNLIGLPIARGKDPHVNDKFYKYLVRMVCNKDIFGIFVEHDRVLGEVPSELNLKIEEIRKFLGELLNEDPNLSQRRRIFKQFVEEFWNKWSILKE